MLLILCAFAITALQSFSFENLYASLMTDQSQKEIVFLVTQSLHFSVETNRWLNSRGNCSILLTYLFTAKGAIHSYHHPQNPWGTGLKIPKIFYLRSMESVSSQQKRAQMWRHKRPILLNVLLLMVEANAKRKHVLWVKNSSEANVSSSWGGR